MVTVVGGVKCAVEETSFSSCAHEVIKEDWSSALSIGSHTASNSTWGEIVCKIRHMITYSLTHPPLTHPDTHSLIHSLTHSPTHSFTHSLTHPLTHPLTHSFAHSLTQSPTHSTQQPACMHVVAHCTSPWISSLLAGHTSILCFPQIVTDCSPANTTADLHSALHTRGSIDQSKRQKNSNYESLTNTRVYLSVTIICEYLI